MARILSKHAAQEMILHCVSEFDGIRFLPVGADKFLLMAVEVCHLFGCLRFSVTHLRGAVAVGGGRHYSGLPCCSNKLMKCKNSAAAIASSTIKPST